MKKHFFRLLLIAILIVLVRAILADRTDVRPERNITADLNERLERTVIGSDLNGEEIAAVYSGFGIERGTVDELYLTNAEERSYLQNGVDAASIGTRTVSCVYVQLLPAGSGLNVRTSNIGWTPEMYESALMTAGITDARIVVAAPYPVTGTGALAGIYKAYEDMTGVRMSEGKKNLGVMELSLLGDLARDIGSLDSTAILRTLKQLLDRSGELDDWQLRQEILNIASGLRVTLTETQLEQLISLCRSLEGLSEDALQRHVDGIQGTLQKVSETRDRAFGFWTRLKRVYEALRDLF